MVARTNKYVSVDGVELHYSAWGDPTAPPVLCVPGLPRVGRDFDPLASTLADQFRVLCLDLPGRGRSQWARDRSTYESEATATLVVAFCDDLGLDEVRWIGTSYGGSLGILLAGGALADRMTHLVVNDSTPRLEADPPAAARERIVDDIRDPPTVDTLAELESYYRDVFGPHFSAMTDAEWRRFTVTSARRTDDGRLQTLYDPGVLVREHRDADPWQRWIETNVDTLLLRGRDSDVLEHDVFEAMVTARPDVEVAEFDCGHAPALNVSEQIDPIREFLKS